MDQRPRIGITMRLELATRRFYLGRDYSEAVEAAGGVPVHLALIPKREYIAAALSQLDGILLPGSDSDVDPKYFGEEPHVKLGTVVPEKDETDMLVLAEAETKELPVFAICFGMQALNVFRNGSLIQDIGSQVENCIKHEQGRPLERVSHAIDIEPGSIIGGLNKAGPSRVNSHHHQAVKDVGENLRAVAWAKDGIVESIQDTRDDRSVMGVQWHPELDWKENELSRNMFKWFITACSFWRRNSSG
jgi:putative glutamine amidotransferase